MPTLSKAAGSAWRFLGSRKVSFWVLGAWVALLLVWLLPFMVTGQPEDTVATIASTWAPFRAVYVALLVTTFACTIPRLARDVRRARGMWATRAVPPADAPLIEGVTLDEARRRLAEAGYAVDGGEAAIRATRRPLSPLGGSLFHLSILLVAAGMVAASATTVSTPLRLTEGQSFEDVAATTPALRALPSAVTERLRHIELASIVPEYYRDVLLFQRLDATVVDAGARRSFSLAQPLWLDPLTDLRIEDFGLAPRFVVKQGGEVLQDSTIAMGIFPPGNEDTAELTSVGWTVSAIAYPDYASIGGRDVTRSYNNRNPRLLVGVQQKESGPVVVRKLMAPGDSVTIGDVTLTFAGLARYGSFAVTRSWALPLLVLAGAAMVAGLGWRILLPRHDVACWPAEDGVRVDAWLDLSGREAGRSRAEALLREGGDAS